MSQSSPPPSPDKHSPEQVRRMWATIHQSTLFELSCCSSKSTVMPPKLMQQVWTVIEGAITPLLIQLSDTELYQQLIEQMQSRYDVSPQEMSLVRQYIRQRVPLIRDIAQNRSS